MTHTNKLRELLNFIEQSKSIVGSKELLTEIGMRFAYDIVKDKIHSLLSEEGEESSEELITSTEFLSKINSIPNYTAKNIKIKLRDGELSIAQISVHSETEEYASSQTSELQKLVEEKDKKLEEQQLKHLIAFDLQHKEVLRLKQEVETLKGLAHEGLPKDCIAGEDEVKFCHWRQGEGNKCIHCSHYK